MNSARLVLGPLFARVLSTVALSGVAGVAACGGTTADSANAPDASRTDDGGILDPSDASTRTDGGTFPGDGGPPIDATEFATPSVDACKAPGGFNLVADIHPASATAVLLYRRDFLNFGTGTDAGCGDASSLEYRSGDPCTGGNAVPNCEATLKCVRSKEGWKTVGQISLVEYFVARDGGTNRVLTTRAELVAFLGTIDTPGEAILLTVLGDRDKPCSTYRPPVATKKLPGGGYEVLYTSGDGCGAGDDVVQFKVRVDPDGNEVGLEKVVLQRGNPGCIEGRRPDGLAKKDAVVQPSPTAAWLADAAHLEAAAVVAFERFAMELRAFGASARLVDDAHRSRADEIRHARTMARLAKKYGAVVPRVQVSEPRARTFEEFAVENVIEGCVRETFAALVAAHQRDTATDPEIAEAMIAIADEETFHAGLAWDVHRFVLGLADASLRATLDATRRSAFRTLRAELSAEPDPSLRACAGLPDARSAIALLDALEADVERTLGRRSPLAA
ncbi:MAG: ferritin-like domain-containing protein [Polyangiaceae bacterium]